MYISISLSLYLYISLSLYVYIYIYIYIAKGNSSNFRVVFHSDSSRCVCSCRQQHLTFCSAPGTEKASKDLTFFFAKDPTFLFLLMFFSECPPKDLTFFLLLGQNRLGTHVVVVFWAANCDFERTFLRSRSLVPGLAISHAWILQSFR